jgi:hypothetical protein
MIEANVPLPQDGEKAKATSTDITMQQIHRNDLLSFFLKEKLRMNNLLVFILLTLITLGCFYVLYSLPGVSAKLVNQGLFALLETFTACLFFTAYIWLPDAVCFLFNSLKENEVLDTSNPKKYLVSYESFYKLFLFWMNRKIWPIGTLIFILLYLLNRYLASGPPFINQVPAWLQIVTAILDGLIAYCAFMSVIRFIISMIFVNYLFHSFPIHVNPLHPDGCGGLGVMHRVLWITVTIILGTTLTFYETVMISVANNIPSSGLDAAVLIIAYLILAPSLLMGWLAFPHHLMLKDRQATLLPLVNEFQQIATKSVLVTEEETPKILADTDRLSAIKRRYELLDETFPTWPVEIRQMRNIIAALGISALLQFLPYISTVIQYIGGLLPK